MGINENEVKEKGVKHRVTVQSSISTPRYLPQRVENMCSHKNM